MHVYSLYIMDIIYIFESIGIIIENMTIKNFIHPNFHYINLYKLKEKNFILQYFICRKYNNFIYN